MTHLVSSRDGLFIFDELSSNLKKYVSGHFFGIVQNGQRWYVFGYEGDKKTEHQNGSIWSFFMIKGIISNWKTEITGLDSGCHQMTIYEDHLYILETYYQRIAKIKIDSDGDLVASSIERLFPWKRALNQDLVSGDDKYDENYLHVNAITVHDGRFFVMCPVLKNRWSNVTSRIQVYDPCSWNMIDEYELGRWFCHDLVPIGHEVYFCDAINSVCKLNIVTRKIEQVYRIPDSPSNLRSICRGLSISENGEILASTKYDGWCGFFNQNKQWTTNLNCSATQITRLDGNDFNNINSRLRRSYVRTKPINSLPFFKGLEKDFERVYETIKDVQFDEHAIENFEKLHTYEAAPSIDVFLNPIFERMTDLEPYCNHLEKFRLDDNPSTPNDIKELIRSDIFHCSNTFTMSGWFYWYPRGRGMGWHTNESQIFKKPNLNFRCYLVKTTGNTFFFYRHPYSKKIHAVHDINSTVNIFYIRPGPDFLWHAVGSIGGDRLSLGYKTGVQGIKELGVKDYFLLIE